MGHFLVRAKSFPSERAPLVLDFANVYFFALGKRGGKVHTMGVLAPISVSTRVFMARFFPALTRRPALPCVPHSLNVLTSLFYLL